MAVPFFLLSKSGQLFNWVNKNFPDNFISYEEIPQQKISVRMGNDIPQNAQPFQFS